MSNKAFRKLVILLVTLIGAGFGTWAGFLYTEKYFLIATILGLISGYVLSLLYLKLLVKIHVKWKIFVFGTLLGVLSGLLCTAFIHGIMSLINIKTNWQNFHSSDIGPFYGLAMIISHIMGAIMGFIAGMVCSLIYGLEVIGKNNENHSAA